MKYAIIAVVLSLFSFVNQQQSTETGAAAQEQASFCESSSEEILQKSALPAEVVTALMNTQQGLAARKILKNGKAIDTATLFRSAKVHLTDSDEAFFLVMGFYPMSGADERWFWMIRQTGNRVSILLFTGANCLNVGPNATFGYKDIETTLSSGSATRTAIFKYDGKTYKLQQAKSTPNK